MISKSTVLVLGAGASKPYYFPVGRELFEQVVQGIRSSDGRLSRQLQVCGRGEEEIDSFCHELERAQQPSVDAFLEHRPEFLEIGKLAIAAELVLKEQEKILIPTFTEYEGYEGRWYDYLFGMMGASIDEFKRNKLAVVTFNYDRSFEHALFLFLKHNNNLSDEEAEELRTNVPVVHMYGQLGGRRYKPTIPGARDPINPDFVQQSADSIKVVHESVGDSPEFSASRSLLQEAEVVCFLGFAYHKQNVERLRLDQLDQGVVLFGTALGLGTAERARAERTVGRIRLYENLDALQFLREVDAFS
ncbi:MAG: hypothetical protein ACETWG_03770 [Candidatus Neomarinimicrobiota bacterium]